MTRNLVLVLALASVTATPLRGQQSCWSDGGQEGIAQRNAAWVLQKSFDDLRVCVLASRVLDTDDMLPSDWFGRASMLVLETRLGTDVHRMRIARGRATFASNDSTRVIDSVAQEWRRAVIDLVDATWLLSRLHAADSSGQGGPPATSGGTGGGQVIAASVSGDLAAMRQELARLRATWSDLDRELTTLRTDHRRLSEDIRTEHSAIQALRWSRTSASQRERARIDREIQRHYSDVGRLQSAMSTNEMNTRSRQTRIATMDLPGRIEKLDREIILLGGGDASGAAADSLRRLESATLDLQSLSREIEAQAEAALQRLRSSLRNRR